jgi:hypothetical protein
MQGGLERFPQARSVISISSCELVLHPHGRAIARHGHNEAKPVRPERFSLIRRCLLGRAMLEGRHQSRLVTARARKIVGSLLIERGLVDRLVLGEARAGRKITQRGRPGLMPCLGAVQPRGRSSRQQLQSARELC